MLKNVFNYLARDVKRSCDLTSFRGAKEFLLGNEDTRYAGGDFGSFLDSLFNPRQARAAIIADRAVTLTGVFATVAAFAFSPAIMAVPAIVGLGLASCAAGYAAAYGVDVGMKKIGQKLQA